MKRHIIAKSTALATFILIFIGASLSMANIPTDDTTDTAEAVISRFKVIPMELPEIDADNMAALQPLSDGILERLLEEKTAFLEETRPLNHILKAKWAALTDELAKQAPEHVTASIQNEISTLDAHLAKMRVAHLMALNDIKANAVN